VKSFGIIVVQ